MSNGLRLRVRHIDVHRLPQVGRWLCTVEYSVTTAEQFSDQIRVELKKSSSFWWAVIKAYWGAWRMAMRLRAKKGERTAKGWV